MYYTVIKHHGHLRKQATGECFLHLLPVVFNHCVIHGVGFLSHLPYDIDFTRREEKENKAHRLKNNKTRFFYILHSDKTEVFDQSERSQGPLHYKRI